MSWEYEAEEEPGWEIPDDRLGMVLGKALQTEPERMQPEHHYVMAGWLLKQVSRLTAMHDTDVGSTIDRTLALAQVHATLATADPES